MKEQKFLGALLPSHPVFIPIIDAVREKYGLREVRPEDESIKEMYLEDRIVSVEEFRQDVGDRVREDLSFFSPAIIKRYNATKKLSQSQTLEGLDGVPDNVRVDIEALMKLAKNISEPIFQGLESFIDDIINMLCFYLLTGEFGEVPAEWSSQVMTISSDDEPAVLIMANQMADPEEVVIQFRQAYRKEFGNYRPNLTKKIVSTAYYLRLKRQKQRWDYIVEEFIRLEDIKLPKNKSSAGYIDRMRIIQQTLKKRMQRSEKILDALLRDKK